MHDSRSTKQVNHKSQESLQRKVNSIVQLEALSRFLCFEKAMHYCHMPSNASAPFVVMRQ
jgi:hypothetical protein